MKMNLEKRLWKSSNVLFKKDDMGLPELTVPVFILGILLVVGVLVIGRWVLGGI